MLDDRTEEEKYLSDLISSKTSMYCELAKRDNQYFVQLPYLICFDEDTKEAINEVLDMFTKCGIPKKLLDYKKHNVLFTLTTTELNAFYVLNHMKES